MNIKTLPTIFKRNGFTFTQIRREGKFAVYEQSKKEKVYGYEVGIISSRRERRIGETKLIACEQWPPNEKWGISGWSYVTSEQAIAKFLTLTRPELFKV